jgi:hypothetical protein
MELTTKLVLDFHEPSYTWGRRLNAPATGDLTPTTDKGHA